MKLFKILAMFMLIATTAACSKVPSGHVGVKVYLLGNDKGVDTEELSVGRYWIGVNEELYLFPTFTQNYVWTADVAEGSPNDESITFQTSEGLNVNADVGISYHIDPTKVNSVFQKYRKGVEEITDIYLRNMVRDAFVAESSVMPVESVYGKGKSELLVAVEEKVKEQTTPLGIVIERIYFVGSLRLPDTVVSALNAKIEATQKAQQRQNEIAQAKAEAQKKIEEARGTAESRLEIAKAEAEAIKLKGEMFKKYPEVLQGNAIDKWNGELPRLTGSAAIPFIDVTKQ